jgi:ligand-binding sensor domain-containing protein
MDNRSRDNSIFNLKTFLSVAIPVNIVLVSMGNTFSVNPDQDKNPLTSELAGNWRPPMEIRFRINQDNRIPAWNQEPTNDNLLISCDGQKLAFFSGNTKGQTPPYNKKILCQPNEDGNSVKNVISIVVDNDNIKWFNTDKGIVSFDGISWRAYDGNENLPWQDLKDVAYDVNNERPELWIATPQGVSIVRLPIDDQAEAVTLDPENSDILSKEVLGIVSGQNSIRWIGTDKGISALSSDTWLTPSYELYYPENMFQRFPITSMAANLSVDSLYVGTAGAGVVRVYRDEVDAISGASVYAQWGPIILPSDNILSIYIAPDGVKWFGTDEGIATHTGNNTLDNWAVYTSEDGLIDNTVQAITGDKNGNIWFGTKAGISVFNGVSWISYTMDDGLASNNILSLAIDKEGIVWIGTDTGISRYENEEFINY